MVLITSQAKVNAMYKPIEFDIAGDSYIYNPEVGSYLKMIDNTLYYDDIKQYPEQILYI